MRYICQKYWSRYKNFCFVAKEGFHFRALTMAFVIEITAHRTSLTNRNESLKEEIARENKTFYRGLKPFALICKLIGVFSLQNVLQDNGCLLKHTLFSFHTLWGPFFVGMATISNTYFETEHFASYIAMFYIIRGISISLLTSYYDKFLPEIIFRIEEFNAIIKSNCNKTHTRRNLNTHGRLVLYIACVGYIILMCANVAVLSLINGYNFPRVVNKICDSFTFLTRQMFVMMYIYFCYNIKLILCSISSIWRQTVKTIVINKSVDPVPPEERLESVRLLHAEAVQTVELINSAYGVRLLFYVTIYCSEVLLSLYEFSNRHVHLKLYFIIYSGFTLYMVTKFTEDITTQVSPYQFQTRAWETDINIRTLVLIRYLLS